MRNNNRKCSPVFSTGSDSFDNILHCLKKGDNVVWQVDRISDYIHFLLPFCRRANKENKPLIYFRFAQHEYLLSDDIKADCCRLNVQAGFEVFILEMFTVIEKYGTGLIGGKAAGMLLGRIILKKNRP